jgi:hypothetical protein
VLTFYVVVNSSHLKVGMKGCAGNGLHQIENMVQSVDGNLVNPKCRRKKPAEPKYARGHPPRSNCNVFKV